MKGFWNLWELQTAIHQPFCGLTLCEDGASTQNAISTVREDRDCMFKAEGGR